MDALLVGTASIIVGILGIKFRHKFQRDPDGGLWKPNSESDRRAVTLIGIVFILAGLYFIGQRFFGLPEL